MANTWPVGFETQREELVRLDAQGMEPLARAPLPHRLPFTFHG